MFAPVDMYQYELSRFREMSWSPGRWVLSQIFRYVIGVGGIALAVASVAFGPFGADKRRGNYSHYVTGAAAALVGVPFFLYGIYDGRRRSRARAAISTWAAARGLRADGGAWGNVQGAQIGARIAFRGRRSASVRGAVVGAFSQDGRWAVVHVTGFGSPQESMAKLDAAMHEALAGLTASGR